jgi:Toxin PAAR-like domain
VGAEVYANTNAIACKAGDGKVIAAFPDVCLSPPSPPAGPVPVPYPDTSFSKDMQNGSKTVMIGGKEVMLKDQSFYKSSPLGDEAATNGLGAGVVTHVITGKTYFSAWSMDVQFEGQNVDRHLDLTTSNHASYPGNSGPLTDMETMALDRIAENRCPCCNKEGMHAGQRGEPVSEEDWYDLNEQIPPDPPEPDYAIIHPGPPETIWPNPAHEAWLAECAALKQRRQALNHRQRIVAEAKKCPSSPKPPCNVYFRITKEQADANEKEWRDNQDTIKDRMKVPLVKARKTDEGGHKIPERGKVDHKVPTSAGGCPIGDGNLQEHAKMSGPCQNNDDELGNVQKECAEKWRTQPRP